MMKYSKRLIGTGILLTATVCWVCIADTQAAAAVLASALRHSTPLILGALCGLFCERSGVMNIGIEGQMLFAAFTGFIVSVWAADLMMGVWAGVLSGAATGLMLAFMCVTLRIDQIIAGSVMNILALGITGYFFQPGLGSAGKLPAISLGPLAGIPLLGPVLFNNTPITYIAILLVCATHLLIYHTRWGLRTRSVGEHPMAADTLGINIRRVRYVNVVLGGALSGLAGVFLTLEAVGTFERAMTSGRGFVALAVMIFGKWTPFGAWGAALIFGLASALQTQLQFEGKLAVPHQFIGMLPYLMTVILLALFVGRSRPPSAVGRPYEKE